MNPSNWLTRYRVKRPFSRKLRIAPAALVDGAVSPAVRRFAADPDLDPLSGALDFLLATYAGDTARAEAVLSRLGVGQAVPALSRLFAENELRKLTVACFRHALAGGPLDREKARLLLRFAEGFDPIVGALSPASPAAAEPARPLAFDYVERLSPKLRVTLLVPPSDPSGASRPYELGERLTSAFAGAGVDCTVLPSETAPDEIGSCDLVLFDEDTAFRKDPARRLAHLDKLRKVAKRLGRLVPDPWGWDFHGRLTRSADRYDFFWAMAPSLRQAVPLPGEKFCLIPFPTGFPQVFDDVAASPPRAGIGFCGTIEDYNSPRYFWLLSELARGSDLEITLTSQRPDGLGVVPSFRIYLERLLGTEASLSLTMRPTGDRILVGRTFDILRGGRLLVQESTPDARHYLTPGEDFIQVDGAAALPEARERIRSGAGEPIRRQGAETFRRAYSDAAVVRHLATWV